MINILIEYCMDATEREIQKNRFRLKKSTANITDPIKRTAKKKVDERITEKIYNLLPTHVFVINFHNAKNIALL